MDWRSLVEWFKDMQKYLLRCHSISYRLPFWINSIARTSPQISLKFEFHLRVSFLNYILNQIHKPWRKCLLNFTVIYKHVRVWFFQEAISRLCLLIQERAPELLYATYFLIPRFCQRLAWDDIKILPIRAKRSTNILFSERLTCSGFHQDKIPTHRRFYIDQQAKVGLLTDPILFVNLSRK